MIQWIIQANKRAKPLRILREIEVNLNSGADVVSACRTAGILDKTVLYLAQEWSDLSAIGLSKYRDRRYGSCEADGVQGS